MKPRSKNNIKVIKAVIEEVSQSARKKAFRLNMPVAISENGQTILLYPDGTRKPFTPEAIAALEHG